MIDYPVEMLISFEGGTGVTRSVSREQVAFATDAFLAAGRLLVGTLCCMAGPDQAGTTLRYSARVTAVRLSSGSRMFEVEARFEDLGFVAPHVAGAA